MNAPLAPLLLLLPCPVDCSTCYGQKLSMRSILVGKSKDRTIKALRERIDKLCASKDSSHGGLAALQVPRLGAARGVLAWGTGHPQPRQEHLHQGLGYLDERGRGASSGHLQCMVHKAAQDYFAKWPTANLPRHSLVLRRHRRGTRKFDYQIPNLRDLPRVQAWRCKASVTSLIDDTVNPLLFEAPAALEKIAEPTSE